MDLKTLMLGYTKGGASPEKEHRSLRLLFANSVLAVIVILFSGLIAAIS